MMMVMMIMMTGRKNSVRNGSWRSGGLVIVGGCNCSPSKSTKKWYSVVNEEATMG